LHAGDNAGKVGEANMLGKDFSVDVRTSSTPGTCVLSVSGSLVLEHLVAFQELWESHPEPFLILDVSRLSYIDSAAIGFLVNAYVSREKNGKKLALAGVQGMAQRVLTVTRVAKVLSLYSSVEEAEESFRRAKVASA
jgi:anti-anti-sigma factor